MSSPDDEKKAIAAVAILAAGLDDPVADIDNITENFMSVVGRYHMPKLKNIHNHRDAFRDELTSPTVLSSVAVVSLARQKVVDMKKDAKKREEAEREAAKLKATVLLLHKKNAEMKSMATAGASSLGLDLIKDILKDGLRNLVGRFYVDRRMAIESVRHFLQKPDNSTLTDIVRESGAEGGVEQIRAYGQRHLHLPTQRFIAQLYSLWQDNIRLILAFSKSDAVKAKGRSDLLGLLSKLRQAVDHDLGVMIALEQPDRNAVSDSDWVTLTEGISEGRFLVFTDKSVKLWTNLFTDEVCKKIDELAHLVVEKDESEVDHDDVFHRIRKFEWFRHRVGRGAPPAGSNSGPARDELVDPARNARFSAASSVAASATTATAPAVLMASSTASGNSVIMGGAVQVAVSASGNYNMGSGRAVGHSTTTGNGFGGSSMTNNFTY
eukprot:TRINITY_DN587_c0_g1_i1.p1 TRINITY_DN587_c0_g1~~TRINITY_DN587_c0_g1_i1.p1  ORF type:complete len:437 (+),score=-10.64 TRINITY_DN587_c0_g1_i1:314-1624(+)